MHDGTLAINNLIFEKKNIIVYSNFEIKILIISLVYEYPIQHVAWH